MAIQDSLERANFTYNIGVNINMGFEMSNAIEGAGDCPFLLLLIIRKLTLYTYACIEEFLDLLHK